MNSLHLSVVAMAALTILVISAPSLSQIVSADKNCSVGKSLNEAFPSPKRGNQVGEDAVLGTQISPGPGVSDYSLNINEECRSNR
jgi:hypothetical protein